MLRINTSNPPGNETPAAKYLAGVLERAGIPAKLLSLAAAPTAVFCYNDMSAIGALKEIRSHGLCVPADISLVGFDDLFIASYVDPPLTTVRQPKRPMGRMAMEILLRLFADDQPETQIKVQGELIVRESTGAPKP